MSRKLSAVLKTDTLKPLAQILRSKGRYGDTILAHITPKEAAKLKREGGSGTINPDTGLPEFFDFGDFDTYTPMNTVDTTPVEAPVSLPTFAQDAGYTSPSYYGGEAPGTISSYGEGGQQGTFTDPRTGLFAETPYASEFAGGQSFQELPYTQVAGGDGFLGRIFGGGTQPTPEGSADLRRALAQQELKYLEKPTEVSPPLSEEEQKSAKEYAAAGGKDTSLFGKMGLSDALKLGIGGLGALMGRQQQQEALKQAKALQAQYAANAAAAAKQQRELAAPLLTPGYTALSQAQQGALTAANQQAFQAMQARLAQSQARSGGVGAIQTAVAEEAARQQALANQVNQAMALIGPGNTLANQAIQTNLMGQQGGLQLGISLSQAANQAAMNMYGALAKFAAG